VNQPAHANENRCSCGHTASMHSYGYYQCYGDDCGCMKFKDISELVNVNSEALLQRKADAEHAYDAGLLGGNSKWRVDQWHDYLRVELARAHDFYQQLIEQEQHQRDVYQKAAATASNYIADCEQMHAECRHEIHHLQERLDAITVLVRKYSHPGCNSIDHALANRVLDLATGERREFA
jgi:hypothetical protein